MIVITTLLQVYKNYILTKAYRYQTELSEVTSNSSITSHNIYMVKWDCLSVSLHKSVIPVRTVRPNKSGLSNILDKFDNLATPKIKQLNNSIKGVVKW